MSTIEAIALTVFCNVAIAAIFVGANQFANGWSAGGLWLLWGLIVLAITSIAVFVHHRIASSVERPNFARGEQAAAAAGPPVAVPRDSANPTNAKQVDSEGANNGISGQQSENPQVIVQSSPIELWFAGAVAGATVLLAGFGAYQLRAIGQQIKIADATVEQMRLEQRPWLALSVATISELNAGEKYSWTVQVRNSGNTPAWIEAGGTTPIFMEAGVSDAEFAQGVEKARQFAMRKFNSIAVPPGGQIDLPADSNQVLEKPEFDGVFAKTTELYLLSYLVYSDSDGKRQHWLMICLRYNPDSNRLVGDTMYNRMDKNGEPYKAPL